VLGVDADGPGASLTLAVGSSAWLQWRKLPTTLADMVGERPDRLTNLLGPPLDRKAHQLQWMWQRSVGNEQQTMRLVATLVAVDTDTFVEELRLYHTTFAPDTICPLNRPTVATPTNARSAAPVLTNAVEATNPRPLVLPIGLVPGMKRADLVRVLGPPGDCDPFKANWPGIAARFGYTDDAPIHDLQLDWQGAASMLPKFPKDSVLQLFVNPASGGQDKACAALWGQGQRDDSGFRFWFNDLDTTVKLELRHGGSTLDIGFHHDRPIDRMLSGVRWANAQADLARILGPSDSPGGSTWANGAIDLTVTDNHLRLVLTQPRTTAGAVNQLKGPLVDMLGKPWDVWLAFLGGAFRTEASAVGGESTLSFAWSENFSDPFERKLSVKCLGTLPICHTVTLEGLIAPRSDSDADPDTHPDADPEGY
jgi:hypothetical protein